MKRRTVGESLHGSPLDKLGVKRLAMKEHRAFDYSGLMPAPAVTLPHFSISVAMTAANASGVPP